MWHNAQQTCNNSSTTAFAAKAPLLRGSVDGTSFGAGDVDALLHADMAALVAKTATKSGNMTLAIVTGGLKPVQHLYWQGARCVVVWWWRVGQLFGLNVA